MNPFFVRLALLGSRRSWGRPLGSIAGIAAGMAMFLLMLGAFGALDVREGRQAWMGAHGQWVERDAAVTLDAGSALVARTGDYYRDRVIARLDIAATADTTIRVPGIGMPPAPGTYFASPALAALIDSAPADLLGARFGIRAGLIADTALQSPDSLVAVVGADAAALRAGRQTKLVTSFDVTPNGDSVAYQIVLGIGAIGMFFPIILFVGIVTRLGAASRLERFAMLRLIGASPEQVARLGALETFVTSTIGALAGIALAALLRPVAAGIAINGGAFFPSDLAAGAVPTAVSVVAMVAVATAVAWIGIRRAGISPLGASRQRRERPPRPRRMLVLVAGLAGLASAALGDALGLEELSPALVMLAMIGGFFLTALGVVLTGPWLTYKASGILARGARSAAGVIAGNRIRMSPAATFRSVSGLVVAVFMVSVFAGAAGGVLQATSTDDASGTLPPDALAVLVAGGPAGEIATALDAVPGVAAVVVTYAAQDFTHGLSGAAAVVRAEDAAVLGLTEPAGTAHLAFATGAFMAARPEGATPTVEATLRAGAEPRPTMLVVRTDGSAAAIERARTAVQVASGGTVFPSTRLEATELGEVRLMRELAFVAYLGAFISIAIAGCSLAIATASAMLDRRRVLGLLRLMGMPLAQLRRIVGLEAAVPLVGVLAVSIALGLLVAWLILTTLSAGIPFVVPEPAYFATIAVGLALALAAVAATFGLVSRSTAVEATRFE